MFGSVEGGCTVCAERGLNFFSRDLEGVVLHVQKYPVVFVTRVSTYGSAARKILCSFEEKGLQVFWAVASIPKVDEEASREIDEVFFVRVL